MAEESTSNLAAELGLEGLIQLLRSLPVGFVLLDRNGRVLLYNDEEARLAGYRASSPEGRNFFKEVAPCADVQELAGAFRRGMEPGRDLAVDLEFVFPFPEGRLDVRLRMRKLEQDGAAYGLVLIDDNTRLKQTERALGKALKETRELALRDSLTGLYNRRHFEGVLPAEVKRARRHAHGLSLLLLDLDRFKEINDRFGHLFGDQVLAAVADALRATLRSDDLCVRWGGEEFCAILPHAGSAEVLRAAERLRAAIQALRLEEHPELRLSVSIGVTTALEDAAGEPVSSHEAAVAAEELLKRADRALYEAKRQGGDRTVAAD